MAKYQNKKDTKKVGERIKELRLNNNLMQDDIATMTGFAKSTIASIERGVNTDISHLIEVAKAIGVHPKEVFNIAFEIKPRYKLSPNKINRILTTSRIRELIKSTFFKSPRLVKDVVNYLTEETGLKVSSTHVSVVLKRLTQEGKLKYKKQGRNNLYSIKKKNKIESN